MDKNRKYFRREITPEIVRAGGEVEVDARPNLPRDEPARWAMFAAMRAAGPDGVPGASHRTALELAGIEDVDLEMSALETETAQRLSPLATFVGARRAAEKQGDVELQMIYDAEGLILLRKKELEMQQLGITPPWKEAAGNNGQGEQIKSRGQPLNKGFPPGVLHGVEVGNAPAYNPAVGPQVPAGTPRPGRMTEEERMMGGMP